jgi:hypothetical protein
MASPTTRLDPFGDPSARPPAAPRVARAAAAALATILALDAAWIGYLGPALGVDFVALVQTIQRAPLAANPVGLLAYVPLTAAIVRSALGPGGGWKRSAEAGLYIYRWGRGQGWTARRNQAAPRPRLTRPPSSHSVYELTNAFCFAAWPVAAIVADSLWGAAMFGAAGAAAVWAAG